MKPQLKKWSIRIGLLLIILVMLVFVFHDNADTDKIAKEQEESSLEKATEQLELLNNEDFAMEEDTINLLPE
jgi:uncharacterized protein YpmB